MFLKDKFPKKNSDNNSYTITMCLGFPGGSVVKNPPTNAGDAGSIPGLKRAPRVGSGNPLQYSCLENSMDRAAWRVTVHGVAESDTISDKASAQGAPRDPRRDSRGERSPWLPLERRPDSPGEPGMQPRDPCLPWRGILGPGHTPR